MIIGMVETKALLYFLVFKFQPNERYCFEGPNEKSLCGAGRYGAVHRVENCRTNKKYAMKIFRPSDNSKYIITMWQKEYEHLTMVSLSYCLHQSE